MAQSATTPFASGQLQIAETTLQGAKEARARGDYALAGRLAAMAEMDSGLAWSMSESPYLRRAAARVSRQAVLLRSQLVISRFKPAAAGRMAGGP